MLGRWTVSFKMNPNKTNFMLKGTRGSLKKTNDFHLNISGSTIISSSSVRFLGIAMDSSMSWEQHVSQVVKKWNSILMLLYRSRNHFFGMTILQWLVYVKWYKFILDIQLFSFFTLSHGHEVIVSPFSYANNAQNNVKMSCCMSVDPYCRPEHIYGVAIALACLYQRYFRNTAGGLLRPKDLSGLGVMRKGH